MKRNASAFPFVGTASAGTHAANELIPTFVTLLSDVLEWASFQPGADDPALVAQQNAIHTRLGEIERSCDDSDEQTDYFDSADAQDDLDWLFETLGEYAPSYFHFGAHEGDGADFGYWLDHDSLNEARESGDLPSGDELPDIPESDDATEFLVVSDHGNATLYVWHERLREWREVWSVV